MSSLGIIVEYNPFHNGHLFHLNEAKRITKAKTTIAVISGSFLQRGEPAIVDKWVRTEMALKSGIDLIIEIPTIYSTQAADWFAFGSISLLNHLKVDNLVFGSESNSIETLHKISDLLLDEPVKLKEYIKEELSLGNSYPKALSLSLTRYLKKENILSTPNDILGVQYLLNLKKLNSNINPITIKRVYAEYNDQTISNNPIASATAIRKSIFDNNTLDNVKNVVPEITYHLLKQEWNANRINSWDNYLNTLLIIANSKSFLQVKNIHGIIEGLEQRIKANTISANFEELLNSIKTKRYTTTKIQRSLLYLLFDLTNEKVSAIEFEKGPAYIRVLGFTEQGRKYLNSIKHDLSIPLITNIPKNHHPMLELDITAAKIYELGFHNPNYTKVEYKQAPIYLTY